MNKNLRIALHAALEAGKAIMEVYNSDSFEVEIKSDQSPLTKADKVSHGIIADYLKQTGIPVLSEEGKMIPFSERGSWDLLWIVDPIDGTKEFIKRNGEFTVNIALVQNGLPILGVVFAPAINELFFSEASIGAFKCVTSESSMVNGLMNHSEKLPLPKGNRPFTVVASKSHLSEETATYIEELRSKHGALESISKGSSLKLCMVAEGIADCYPRFAPTMEWDTAAGQAICRFAGKIVKDVKTGDELIYNRKDLLNNWFLAE
ncbi:MAG: 3'(2'),5'-bisphosphate nucleotidase CysQ [Fluviicola sp.]|jgi:3'(2'), 5'-bisphosphate nucleotidase